MDKAHTHGPIEVPGWNEQLTFAPAFRAGDFVYVSGLTSTDANGEVLHQGDIAQQTREIYHKIEAILQRAGGGLESIVETTEFYVPNPHYKKTAQVRREIFKGRYPAATGIPVNRLIRKGALIEIRSVAYIPKRA